MIFIAKVACNMEIVKITKRTKNYDGNPRLDHVQISSRNIVKIFINLPLVVKVAYNVEVVKKAKFTKIYGGSPRKEHAQI